MYCDNCGKKIAEESQFCRFCGSKQDNFITKDQNLNKVSYLKRLFKGRLNRRNFFIGNILLVIIWFISLFALGGVFGMFGINNNSFETLLVYLSYILLVFYLISFAIRRLHDTGSTGWGSLGYFLPGINTIIFIILSLQGGKNEKNKFGNIPEPKTNLYEIFGLINR